MAQITNNPWSLTSADVASASITAATGLTLNANGSVSMTTTGALTFNATFESQIGFTVIGATAPAYNGFYTLQSGASGGTAFTMIPNFTIPAGTAQSGGGTLAQVLYRNKVRVEDISWQNTTTTPLASGVLQLDDKNGNIIWEGAIGATDTLAQLNRGKVFWVNGITPISIPATTIVLLTVN